MINKCLKEPLALKPINVVGGGEEWAVVELEAEAECKNGESSLRGSFAEVIDAVRLVNTPAPPA